MPKNKKAARDKRLLVAKNMPPLRRTQPECDYNYNDDEVFKWISERPGLLNYVFDKLTISGYIEYNPDTGKWQGVDFEDGD